MGYRERKAFKDILNDLGLTTGLQLCLDAGDILSYDGTNATWFDRSPSDADFWLGSISGADANDPTFVGTAGDLKDTTYWSHSGTTFFTNINGTAGTPWLENFHKANAKLTLVYWFNPTNAAAATQYIFSTALNAVQTGFQFYFGATSIIRITVQNGASTVLDVLSTLTVKQSDAWQMVALSVDEAGNSGIFHINGQSETFAAAYASPSGGASSSGATLGARNVAGTGALRANTRTGAFLAWNRALSAAELLSLWQYPGVAFTTAAKSNRAVKVMGY